MVPTLTSVCDYWKNHSFGYMDLCLCRQSNACTFNMLSRFVIAFFLRSKYLLISWLQSPSAVILEPRKIKSVTLSIVSPSICHEVMGLDGEGNGTPLQYSCLENPVDGGTWKAAVHGVAEGQTRLSNFTFTYWRRKWQPTPVFLPGESQGRGSLVGCRLWGRAESDTTEVT